MSPESASIIAASISGVAVLGVAVVGLIGTRSHRQTREALSVNTTATHEVLHQVKNDHGTNLREDLDAHAANLTRLASMVGQVARDVRDVKRDQKAHDAASAMVVRELTARDRELADEIERHHPRT